MLRVNSGTENEDCSRCGTLHSWMSPASCRHIALGKTPEVPVCV
jgi:hypothetical protein